MPRRTPVVGGNWKMHTDRASAVALAVAVRDGCADLGGACDVVVYPPFPYLLPVAEALGDGGVQLGGQDVYHQPQGAFTGEVSPAMLLDAGARHVLVGHSERRHVIGEPDELVNRKLLAALEAGLAATLCVGETIEQRDAGLTREVNLAQVKAGLAGVPGELMRRVTIAYEPVWAIGTGRTATPGDAEAVHGLIRGALRDLYDDPLADSTRIQYGGSVKANNARDLFAPPDIDGGLIGGASLSGGEFLQIVRAAAGTA